MVQKRSRLSRLLPWSAALLALVLTAPVAAQVVKKRGHTFDDLAFQRSEFNVNPQISPLDETRTLAATALQQDFDTLLTKERVNWQMGFDRMTGLPDTMGGEGIAWIPGSGWRNSIRAADLGLRDSETAVPVAVVAKKALEFVRAYPSLFGARLDELSLNTEGSGPMLDYLYYAQFDWIYQGVPVENARLVFTLNHGNLIEVGQSNIAPAIRDLDTNPSLNLETAWQIVHGFLGEAGQDPADEVIQPGRLLIVPAVTGQALQGLPSEPGQGLGYRLVWVVVFHRDGVLGVWEARVDAHTGEILSFKDSNDYGSIKGGVYKTDKPFVEQNVPLPYVDYGGAVFADQAGNFPGSSGTSTLTGRTGSAGNVGSVDITDDCGSISLAASGGVINFGTSGGYDCTTPGSGGAGNTHAARTQYWNIAQIKIKAYTYLTTNSWLQGLVVDRVNMNQTCNAYWGSGSLHFFRSGGGCWNTGELPGVSLHEFGHGMDANDGNGSAPDGGTGETYGDITALLQTHNSCMGNGFMGRYCGYGDACLSCTGVRELDYAKYGRNVPYIPSYLDDASGFHCPTGTCVGPCNYECHCESLVASQAVYDLATRDLITWGMDQATAWQTVDRLWYVSRPSATGAYSCSSTGTAPNKVFTTSGCANGSIWRVFRAADDDDGTLTNGTPHMTALSAAFSRHVIACTTDAGYNTNSTTCPALVRPAVNATAANVQVLVNWNAITNAANYLVYRNETSCEAGYTKIATVASPTTTYTDTLVVNGVTYFYRIQAQGTDVDCLSPVSDCGGATPSACTPPTAPSGLTATPNGTYRIDLGWGTVAGAVEYNLYRGTATGGPYTALATVSSAATSYSDTTPVGGATYYYVVRTVNGCESINSNQASATAGGTCNVRPTFGGLVSAANALNATCQVNLTWAAGTSSCSGTLTYSVYRSRLAGFTPSPANRIASGLAGTTYTDLGGSFKQRYYYIVRALDSVSGLEDANTLTQNTYPTGTRATVYSNTFEANETNWTKGTTQTPLATSVVSGGFIRGDPEGTVNNYGSAGQPETGHASVNCEFSATNVGGAAGVDDIDFGEVRLISPSFSGLGYPSVEVDLWRWFLNDHSATASGCIYPDGYALEVSNNGTTWTTLEALDETCSTEKNCGTNQWTNVKFTLEDFTSLTGTMYVRMRAFDGQNAPPSGTGVCAGDLVEAALDDFYVYGYNTCTACTAPATPVLSSATPNGANRIDLAWTGSATTYSVFRSEGACPGTTFVQVGGNIAGTTFSDTTVSGGIVYAYVVRGYSATYCESAASGCQAATATGTCSLGPTFAGVATVASSHSATCGVSLTWAAATVKCGSAAVYNIYRSTSASFTPGDSTRIAKSISGTGYIDTANLVYGTTYYYVVRAEDNTTGGTGPGGGNEETNTVRMSAGPSGGQITGGTLFSDNFNTGTGTRGWDTGYFAGTSAAEWRGVMTCSPNQSTPSLFRWGGNGCATAYPNSVANLASPVPNPYGLDIPYDATNVRLTFYHRGAFGTGDGAVLMLQMQPVATYGAIGAAAIIAGRSYTGTMSATNTLANYPCWNGSYNTQMYSTTVDLDAACLAAGGVPCAGRSLAISFVGAADADVTIANGAGWFIDDVTVTADYGTTSCTTAGCAIVVQLTPSSKSVAAGLDILFTASHTAGVGPYAYQWTEDGSNISGATTATLAVNKATAQSHTYNCKVTDLNGVCSDVVAATAATGAWTSAGGTAAPVPGSVTPNRITKNDAAATDINMTWDATNCTSTDYHIIWGYGNDIATLGGSTPVVSGGKCDIGTTGTLTSWNSGVPDPASDPSAGKFVWFIVVGDDNATKEGSWGTITGGGQRGGTANSGRCSCTTRDTTTTCATP